MVSYSVYKRLAEEYVSLRNKKLPFTYKKYRYELKDIIRMLRDNSENVINKNGKYELNIKLFPELRKGK
ncbi:hypothetical protein CMI37_15060 [Candidatus Pacearchaeota archaeon]|nr:hypothetical protein [Candidatus Pacearchaeota archaeon]